MPPSREDAVTHGRALVDRDRASYLSSACGAEQDGMVRNDLLDCKSIQIMLLTRAPKVNGSSCISK